MTEPESTSPEQPPRRRRRRPCAPLRQSKTTLNKLEKSKFPKKIGPTKAETALLPPFQGLKIDRIVVPSTAETCHAAVEKLLATGAAGFDTEAKPTFRLGQKVDGPHVVQFALDDKAFIFQLHRPQCEAAVCELLSSQSLLKVGFGLSNDRKQIRERLDIKLRHVLDLDTVFKRLGYRGQIGVRGAIGVLLKQSFKKSKSITTSNWALPKLTPKQLLYAANDAYAALKTMEALKNDDLLE